MIALAVIAVLVAAPLVSMAAAERVERAVHAQVAAEIWSAPVGGDWRNDQRARAARQHLGWVARVPFAGRRMLALVVEAVTV